MIPVRVHKSWQVHIVDGSMRTLSPDHPLYAAACPVCNHDLGAAPIVLVYVGADPDDRARASTWMTGAAVAVHRACAGPLSDGAPPAAEPPHPADRSTPMTHHPPATAPDQRLYGIGDLARALGGDDTSFTGDLLRLIAKAQATPENRAALVRGFPRETRAYHVWMHARPEPTTDELLAALELPYFACPRCGRFSEHPTDLAEGYCGACHDWTASPGGKP